MALRKNTVSRLRGRKRLNKYQDKIKNKRLDEWIDALETFGLLGRERGG